MNEQQFEEFRKYLPHYLNDGDKRALYEELRKFPEKTQYFASSEDQSPLQGDAWRPFAFRDFSSGDMREVAGIVISNSCDIDPANTPDGAQHLLFAPLMKLDGLRARFAQAGLSDEKAEDILRAIRRQEKSDFLYLPANGDTPETFVRLDDIHPQPLSVFLTTKPVRLFSLSYAGFFILLIKLAIHFTRINERVVRGSSKL